MEVDASVDVLESHELVDNIEQEFFENTNVVLTGHLDPIVVNDQVVNEMRVKVAILVKEIDEKMTIHDFRMVQGAHNTNLIFDIAVPYETKLSDEQIKDSISQKVKTLGSYKVVCKVEKQTI